MPVAEALAALEHCTNTHYGHLIEPIRDELDADRQIFGTEALGDRQRGQSGQIERRGRRHD
jgi:hypothetical protein